VKTTNESIQSCRAHYLTTPLRSTLAGVLLLGTAALASADVRLKGTVGSRTINDNVIIARNTTCVLNGTTIRGNIIVRAGAKLYANGARVTGNVQADNSFLVDLRQSTRVGGDVQGKATRSILVRGGTWVGGNVQLTEGSAGGGVDALLVRDATVVGDVQAEKSGGRLRAIDNRIFGNLQFVENRRGNFVIRDNAVREDLQFFKNLGFGKITGNLVGGNLQSKGNSPRPEVRRNTVEGDLELE
jgi:hypothetical protein